MGTTACRASHATRFAFASLISLGIVTMSACSSSATKRAAGTAEPPSSASIHPSGTAKHGYRVIYTLTAKRQGGELNFDRVQVLTDGAAKVKMVLGDEGYVVSDGTSAVSVSGDVPQYQKIKAADVTRFVLHVGDVALASWCAAAQAAGPSTVLNRPVRRYTCRAPNPDSATLFQSEQLWLDQDTGLVMGWANQALQATASQLDLNATFAADTFSATQPSSAHAVGHPGLPTFEIPRVGGGTLASSFYRSAPLIIVTGRAADIRPLIARVLPLTSGGTSPIVIALMDFYDFSTFKGSLLNKQDVDALAKQVSASVGRFQVSVGIDFKGQVAGQMTAASDPHNPGTYAVLIDSAGTVAQVAPASVTDDELRHDIDGLS